MKNYNFTQRQRTSVWLMRSLKFFVVLLIAMMAMGHGAWAVDYYSKSTGSLHLTSTWGPNPDGSGTAPSDFTIASCIYHIQNNGSPTITAAWTVSGSGSKVIVGDGTNACTFTIPSGFAYSSVATDISNAGIVKNQNSSVTSLGTCNVLSGGKYEHNVTSGTIPTATWNSGSTCEVTGMVGTQPTGTNQTFYNFSWNCPNQTGDCIFEANRPTAINGTFLVENSGSGLFVLGNSNAARSLTVSRMEMTGGVFYITGTGASATMTLSITGDYSQSGGTFEIGRSNSIAGTCTIGGSYTNYGGLTRIMNNSGTGGIISTLTVTGDLTITGNATATGGTLDINVVGSTNAGRLFVKGNLTVSSGSISSGTLKYGQSQTSGSSGVYFDGTGAQTFTHSGGTIATVTGGVGRRFYYKTTGGPTTLNETYSSSIAQTTINGSEGSPVSGYSVWPVNGTVTNNIIISNSSATGVALGAATTIKSGGSCTINAGSILSAAYTFTNSGTTTVNGAFQLNAGGWATGSNFSYGSNGTLVFNGSSGQYGVNNDVFWPTLNGPVNVTVKNGGGITMNVARTVTGTFLLVTGTNAVQGTTLTLNGTTQINGGNFQTAPTYGSSSTLIYNTTYGTSNEWTGGASNTVAAGSGIPANVTVQTGTLTLGGGRGVPGNVTVQSGAGLVLNATSGDLYIGGNLVNSGSTWTNNGRAVFFVLGDTQTITAGSGTQYFDYLVLDKSAGSVQLASTNVTINTTAGSVLQLINTGGLDLNGRTLALNNSGGGIYVNGNRSITSTVSGGKLDINQYKYVANNSGTGRLALDANVTVNLNANGNLDFGNSSGYITTLSGTLSINSTTSCFVNTNPPIYGSGSLVKYNSSGSYGRGLEWSATSGAAYPHHVQISNNTTFDMGANSGTATARQCAGNLTVDAGSTFSMNVSPMTAAVTVMGNVVNNGTVTLSGSIGGDLKTQGNINDNGTFNANSRAIFFNGGNIQVIQGTGVFDISYVRINKSAGSVQLATNLTCEGPGGGNAMEIDGAASVLDLNGFTLYLGKAGVASTYNSGIVAPGVIKGSTASNISILGNGTLGTINFDQTTPGTTNALQNLTINRTSTGTVILGNAVVIGGTLTLTDGTLSGTLTYGPDGILTYNGTAYSTTSDVEFPAASGPKDLNITVANGAGITLHANRTITGNLSIATGQKMIIPSSTSFISNTVSDDSQATVKRFIESDAKWHFLSSPVSGQIICDGNFAPTDLPANYNETVGKKYDFYQWSEPTSMTIGQPWINLKKDDWSLNKTDFEGDPPTFAVGKGYLVDYDASFDGSTTKSFTGTLIAGSQNIALTTGGNTWNLIGNPFSSSVFWDDVTTTDILADGYYYIYNELKSGGAGYESYLDATHKTSGTNGYISAMQGFFVRAAGTPLVIPNAARKHNDNWLKNDATSPVDQLKLTLGNGVAFDETFIVFEAEGSLEKGFYDAGKLLSMNSEVPQVYTLKDNNQKICINSLPYFHEAFAVPVGLLIPADGNYTLQLSGMESFPTLPGMLLEDLKTNTTQNMVQNPVYSFTAATSDNANRFLLHFSGSIGINEKPGNNPFNVFTSGNSVFVTGTNNNTGKVYVYNLMGQLVATSTLNGNTPCKLNVNVPVGYYLVKVISSEQAYSTKIFINQR